MIVLTESTREKVLLAAQVCAAQRGNREAFGQLVECFQRAVYSIAVRRLQNHAEAQELAQEVFVQALRKIGQLREPECFGGWLRSITTRMAINRSLRSGPVMPIDRETLEATCVERRTPLVAALANERASQVAPVWDGCALDRETLEAFYVRGQSLVEMSDKFRSPIGTIKRRLHVVRKRLARELEELRRPDRSPVGRRGDCPLLPARIVRQHPVRSGLFSCYRGDGECQSDPADDERHSADRDDRAEDARPAECQSVQQPAEDQDSRGKGRAGDVQP